MNVIANKMKTSIIKALPIVLAAVSPLAYSLGLYQGQQLKHDREVNSAARAEKIGYTRGYDKGRLISPDDEVRLILVGVDKLTNSNWLLGVSGKGWEAQYGWMKEEDLPGHGGFNYRGSFETNGTVLTFRRNLFAPLTNKPTASK